MRNVLEMAVLGESASQEITHFILSQSDKVQENVEIVQMTILHMHTDKELTKLSVQSVSWCGLSLQR